MQRQELEARGVALDQTQDKLNETEVTAQIALEKNRQFSKMVHEHEDANFQLKRDIDELEFELMELRRQPDPTSARSSLMFDEKKMQSAGSDVDADKEQLKAEKERLRGELAKLQADMDSAGIKQRERKTKNDLKLANLQAVVDAKAAAEAALLAQLEKARKNYSDADQLKAEKERIRGELAKLQADMDSAGIKQRERKTKTDIKFAKLQSVIDAKAATEVKLLAELQLLWNNMNAKDAKEKLLEANLKSSENNLNVSNLIRETMLAELEQKDSEAVSDSDIDSGALLRDLQAQLKDKDERLNWHQEQRWKLQDDMQSLENRLKYRRSRSNSPVSRTVSRARGRQGDRSRGAHSTSEPPGKHEATARSVLNLRPKYIIPTRDLPAVGNGAGRTLRATKDFDNGDPNYLPLEKGMLYYVNVGAAHTNGGAFLFACFRCATGELFGAMRVASVAPPLLPPEWHLCSLVCFSDSLQASLWRMLSTWKRGAWSTLHFSKARTSSRLVRCAIPHGGSVAGHTQSRVHRSSVTHQSSKPMLTT